MSPLLLGILLVLSILLLALPKKYAAIPFFIGICFIPQGPSLELGALSFGTLRCLVSVGFIRVLMHRETMYYTKNPVNRAFFTWMILYLICGLILNGGFGGIVEYFGKSYDAFGVYFLFRCFLSDKECLIRFLKIVSICIVPLAFLMVTEVKTGKNWFYLLGGLAEGVVLRDGKIRSSAVFGSPILAGTAGAISFGFIAALFFQKKERNIAIIGLIGSLLCVYASNSSGPIMTCLMIFAGFMFWGFRYKMNIIRLTILLTLVVLNFTMNAPVWSLIARVDLTGSSTGYHRSELISSAIAHFSEWWLCGTNYTRHWMATGVTWSPDHTDITNHYLYVGVKAGFFTMVAFILLIAAAFKAIGTGIRRYPDKHPMQLFGWAYGSTLLAISVSFLTVAFFDQTIYLFYILIALCANYGYSIDQEEVVDEVGIAAAKPV